MFTCDFGELKIPGIETGRTIMPNIDMPSKTFRVRAQVGAVDTRKYEVGKLKGPAADRKRAEKGHATIDKPSNYNPRVPIGELC